MVTLTKRRGADVFEVGLVSVANNLEHRDAKALVDVLLAQVVAGQIGVMGNDQLGKKSAAEVAFGECAAGRPRRRLLRH